MRLYRNNIIYFILALAVILSSYTLYHYVLQLKTTYQPPHQYPDAYATHITAIQMNNKGHVHSRLISVKLVHYPTSNITNFWQPEITLYQGQKQPWIFRADYGQTRHGQRDLELWQHVVIQESKGEHNPPLSLQTHDIDYYPKQHFAETAWPVVLTKPGVIIHAVGMKAYTKRGITQLLSHVRGLYVPSKTPKK